MLYYNGHWSEHRHSSSDLVVTKDIKVMATLINKCKPFTDEYTTSFQLIWYLILLVLPFIDYTMPPVCSNRTIHLLWLMGLFFFSILFLTTNLFTCVKTYNKSIVQQLWLRHLTKDKPVEKAISINKTWSLYTLWEEQLHALLEFGYRKIHSRIIPTVKLHKDSVSRNPCLQVKMSQFPVFSINLSWEWLPVKQ